MATLTIGEAAARLHASPSTIRSWEQRLGFPVPVRASSGHRRYHEAQIALLSDALRRGLKISSAIREVRAQTCSHGELLQEALRELDFDGCDTLLESAIAYRGLSRAFDDTVLAAIEELAADEPDEVVTGLALEWATDRTTWARRHATTSRVAGVVIVDSSRDASATRLAGCVLHLQLALRSVHAYPLRGAPTQAYGSAARRLQAAAIVFIGGVPTSLRADNADARDRLTSFRTEGVEAHRRVESLPSQPRPAADRVVGALNSAPSDVELAPLQDDDPRDLR